ncbi:unnamed protein product, partial [Ixodes hexagonus]
PLLLTPFINSKEEGDIETRMTKSKVHLFKEKVGVDAYSGFITVRNESGNHLFFLLTKAPQARISFNRNVDTSPLVLWLQGGPGKSSLYGQFLENGPLGIDADGMLFGRTPTIQEEASIIYLDQPAGTGFSFLQNYKNPLGYAKTLQDMTDDIEEFLRQFFIMFPEYEGRDFYVAGESYGARAALGIAERILCSTKIPRNISGVILGAGFLAPLLDLIDSSNFLYNVRLLDVHGRDEFAAMFEKIRLFAKTNRTLALYFLSKTVLSQRIDQEQSLFQELTSFSKHGSVLYSEDPPEVKQYRLHANSTAFKQAIHVGQTAKLDALRPMVTMMLGSQDFFNDIKPLLINVLNTQRVLLYTAQMDAVFPAVKFSEYFNKVEWIGHDDFAKAKREPWYACKDTKKLLGYVKNCHNLSYATVLAAGHYATRDAPLAVHHLVSRFL